MFMAQVTSESQNLNHLEEGFRYTKGIEAIPVKSAWRNGRVELEEAHKEALQGKPEHLAELMYGDRMGNDEPGDSYKYRGRGYMQLTGKDQYAAAGKALGLDLVRHPELAADPGNASKIAIHYWLTNVPKAAREDIDAATQAINGGDNGIGKRKLGFADWQYKLTPQVMAGLAKGEVNLPVTPITDKHHPGHALYKQALVGLEKFNAAHDIPSDQRTQNAAAVVAVEAHHHGLKRIDHVEPNVSGDKLIAVQGKAGSAHSRIVDVPTVEAMHTPIAQSAKAFLEAQQHVSTQHPEQMVHQSPQQTAPALSR